MFTMFYLKIYYSEWLYFSEVHFVKAFSVSKILCSPSLKEFIFLCIGMIQNLE